MKRFRLQAINSQGIAHFIVPLLCVVVVAIVGVYMLVGSKAATPQTKLSTYYLFSAGGQYTHVQVSSSKNFKNARCSTKKIPNGKFATFETPKEKKGSHASLPLRCLTPVKATDAYYINFYTSQPTGSPNLVQAVEVKYRENLCVFVHSNDAPDEDARGVTRTLPRGADGKCVKASADDEVVTKERTPAKDPATKLYVPPNFSETKRNKAGYYFLPPSPGNRDYYIHTKSMPGGESTSDSPASQRYGKKVLIQVFYTAAVKYHDKYPNSKLVAGDLNAPQEHASHDKGVDIDIYSSDRTAARVSSTEVSRQRSIYLAKALLDTRKIQFIFYNDTSIHDIVNKYAERKGLPGRMMSDNATHAYHFHVRIND